MIPPKGKPADLYEHLIIIGTSAGSLKLIDLNRNRILKMIQMMQERDTTIFQLDWNAEGFIAIASTDQSIYVKKYEPED